MIIYVEKHDEIYKNAIRTNQFSKFADYKINKNMLAMNS